MKTLPVRTLLLCLLVSAGFGTDAHGQMDPGDPPEPPVERLAALQPFLGLYSHADQTFGPLGPWAGTLEVKPAVKGWYVEWVINTHHRAIDRQNRMIMTWDEKLGRYRVWRFETTPQLPRGVVEGSARFVGDTLVMEWEDFPGPRGGTGTYRNRAFMDGADELVIITDVLPDGASEPILLGEWRNQRRL